MRNYQRISAPYALGVATSGSISVAGLVVGDAPTAAMDDQTIVAIKTNGGTLVAMPAPYATASAPQPQQQSGQSSGSSS